MSYYLPAEWEPHEVTWLSWPNQQGATYPGELLDQVLPSFIELVEVLVEADEKVAINVSSLDEKKYIEYVLNQYTLSRVDFFSIPTNEPWCRDHGPTILRNPETGIRKAICWKYDAWGGKYPPWQLDATAAPKMAKAFGICPSPEHHITLEGGSIESDGNGLLMISESSVVCQRRNPGKSRQGLETEIKRITGSEEILWVNAVIPGDDTDGHVDCFARFAPENTILALDPIDSDCSIAHNANFLREWTKQRGWNFVGLPIPKTIAFKGEVLPATYANFYIANEAVIVPVFNDPADGIALELINSCFPGREVVPFPSRGLILGQGGIHCLTQPLPK